MKKLLTLITLVAATSAFAQGRVNFANSAATLISAGGASTAITDQYLYAIFLAPSTTVLAAGQSSSFTDPVFQTQGGSNVTQHATAIGRIAGVNGFDTGGAPGGTVDFIVRGWSANAGSTWAQALASWNNGAPENPALAGLGGMFIGQSLVGNNILLGDGGAIGATTLFGAGATQVPGFNMAFVPLVPEPSSMALAGLGAASLLLFRRRK